MAPTVRAVGTAAASAAAISPGLPAGTVAGDLLVMGLVTKDQAITVADWTEGPSSPQSVASATRLTIFYKIAVGSDATTTSDSGTYQLGRIIGITAGTFDPTTPINTSAGGTQLVTAAVSVPGGTTTVADCLVLAFTSGDAPDATTTTEFSLPVNADLTGLVEQIDNSSTADTGCAIGAWSGVKATAGAYAATTATAANTANRGVISLAITPAATVDPNLYPYVGGGYYPN